MELRTIHGITWQDDLAWMEAMKGNKWKNHIQKERARWNTALNGLKTNIEKLEDELVETNKVIHSILFRTGSNSIEIGIDGPMTYMWKFAGSEKGRTATNLEANKDGSVVWTIEEIGDGAEYYVVRMREKGVEIPRWEHKGVAPFLAIVGNRCYCLEAKKRLVYWRLVSWDSMTGKDRKVHYEEQDYRYNLDLIGGDATYAFVRRYAGTKQDAFLIDNNGDMKVLEGITLEPRRFIFGRKGSYLVWSSEGGWKGPSSLELVLPKFDTEVPEIFDDSRGLCVTKWEGQRTLWKLRKDKKPVVIWKGYAQILIDPWDSSWIRFVIPGQEAVWWNSESQTPVPIPAGPGNGNLIIEKAKSLDGTLVPFLIVSHRKYKKSQGLLVVGYGAYGIPMNLMTQRWEPLLHRGWTLVIGLWRGGGDHTPEWEDAGRCYGRKKVLEDAEAVVRAAQKMVGVDSAKTVIYGRSAGGLWVGGLTAKYPKGELIGGAYMEVPYLDVLRTTTNRELPLTDIETDEFGLPELRISDFVGMMEWSPMELLLMSGEGIPGVWQIVRTGENDSEVLTYESVKWIVRSKNPSAFLAIEGAQGHFVSGARGFRQQAEDLAFILSKVS